MVTSVLWREDLPDQKDPSDVIDRVFDFTNMLDTGETIDTAAASSDVGITAQVGATGTSDVTLRISGGQVDTTYRVTCEITTTPDNQTFQRSVLMEVKEL